MPALLRRRGIEAIRRAGSPAFDPLTLPGGGAWHTVTWLSDPNWTNPGDGNPIPSLRDGGTAAADWIGSGSARPTYRASVASLNNQPAAEFDGVDDVLAQVANTIHAQPGTAVLVARTTTGAGDLMDINTGTARWLLDINTSLWRMLAGTALMSATATNSNAHVFFLEYNGASSTFRLDGTQIASGNAGAQNFGTVSTFPQLFKSGAAFSAGHLAFVGLTSGALLNSTDRAYLEAGFKTLYGTP